MALRGSIVTIALIRTVVIVSRWTLIVTAATWPSHANTVDISPVLVESASAVLLSTIRHTSSFDCVFVVRIKSAFLHFCAGKKHTTMRSKLLGEIVEGNH